jgi:hypothetical protein
LGHACAEGSSIKLFAQEACKAAVLGSSYGSLMIWRGHSPKASRMKAAGPALLFVPLYVHKDREMSDLSMLP